MRTRTAIFALCAATLVLAAGETALAQNYPVTGITISLPANPDANTNNIKKNKGASAKSGATASKNFPKSRSRGVGENSSPIPRDR